MRVMTSVPGVQGLVYVCVCARIGTKACLPPHMRQQIPPPKRLDQLVNPGPDIRLHWRPVRLARGRVRRRFRVVLTAQVAVLGVRAFERKVSEYLGFVRGERGEGGGGGARGGSAPA